MIKNQKVQLLIAVLLFLTAGTVFFQYWRDRSGSEPMIYFYDMSAGELFSAPQSAVPPIKGVDGDEEDGVRAIVISRTPGDVEIAYLEKYSPEMKAQFEARRSGEEIPPGESISRAESKAHTFVKTLEGDQWYPMTSEEAVRIVSDWNVKGANGEYPLVQTP